MVHEEQEKSMKEVTILINARNEERSIGECLGSLADQNYGKDKFDVLVMDDASSDRTGDITESMAKKHGNIIHKRYITRQGRVKCINLALELIKTPYFIEFNADCTAERGWLSKIMRGFTSQEVGVVKSSSLGEGISTAFRTDLIRKTGGVDDRYNEFGAGFRYDTDMIFSIKEMGYKIVFVDAHYGHSQKAPSSLRDKVKYAIYRIKIHRFDVLLYKRHPEMAKEYLKIKFGFVRDPMEDFRVASGTWGDKKKLSLSSPQGISLIDEKTPLHFVLIVSLAWLYVFFVKMSRLHGSLIYKKLLI
jgi:glycosyltransferase involved in cell wall biosynthesis